MHRLTRLPARFPANTKYILESRGPWVRRYIEFPDGRTVELSPRKAQSCECATLMQQITASTDFRRGKRGLGAAA